MVAKIMPYLPVVAFILMFLFIGHLEVTDHPFRITLKYWHRTLGALLITIGLCIYCIGERHKAYVDGRDAALKMVKELSTAKNEKVQKQ